jgi:hypothetical protein
METMNGYKSLLRVFAHIDKSTVQRKDISRWKVKTSSINNK